jgi:hypothetical protein
MLNSVDLLFQLFDEGLHIRLFDSHVFLCARGRLDWNLLLLDLLRSLMMHVEFNGSYFSMFQNLQAYIVDLLSQICCVFLICVGLSLGLTSFRFMELPSLMLVHVGFMWSFPHSFFWT